MQQRMKIGTHMVFIGLVALGGCGDADPANALIGSKNTAEYMKAKMQMKSFADALRADELSTGEWPVSLDTLTTDGRIRASDLEDPWGEPFVYAPPETMGDNPVLYSFGPDREGGTQDDIEHEWQ